MAKLFVCGDITNMSGSNNFIDDKLTDIIKKSDYAIGNLEGPEIGPSKKAQYPHQSSGTIKYLKDVGFNMLLLANNHITEQGAVGLATTMNLIDETGMDRIGAGLSWEEAYKPLIRKIDGVSFGFVNICEAQDGYYKEKTQQYGFAWMGYDGLFDNISSLSTKVDKVVVFVHTGLEHYPIPLPEVRSFYRHICDAGASVVIGGHTHSPQGYEFYGDKFIAYSLGNFFFPRTDGSWKEENRSYSLCLDFKQNGKAIVTPVFHTLNGDEVELCYNTNNTIDIRSLCAQLSDDYLTKADDMCIDAYKSKYSKILAMATCGESYNTDILSVMKNILRTTLLRKKYVKSTLKLRTDQMLMCFQNETRRSTITRALNKLSKN